MEPGSPALQVDSLATELSRKPFLPLNFQKWPEGQWWQRWEASRAGCRVRLYKYLGAVSWGSGGSTRARKRPWGQVLVSSCLAGCSLSGSSHPLVYLHSLPRFSASWLWQAPIHPVPFSHLRIFATPWTAAHQASSFITNSQSLLKLMPSNHLILCHPLLLLPSIFPSIRVFSSESVLWIRWPKYWSFSFSISPSNE